MKIGGFEFKANLDNICIYFFRPKVSVFSFGKQKYAIQFLKMTTASKIAFYFVFCMKAIE